jgi:cobalamin biosynthesis Mg chelatase CobN
VAAVLAISLACAAPAFAGSAFNTLFHEYQATGGIKACKHTTAELQAAENQVPPDITQYAPDFPAALQAALETRAHGGCGGAGAAGAVTSGSGSATTGGATGASAPATSGIAPGPTPAPIASPAAASPIAQAAAHAGGGGASSAPVPLIALAVVMVLLALAAIWWSVTTLRGTESTRMSTAGHTLGEARLRAGGTLREFADWLRLGR